MCRRSEGERSWLLAAACGAAVAACAPAAWAQAAIKAQEAEPAIGDANDALEAYLEAMGLNEPLAAHLRKRLKEGLQADRVKAAERLGALYAQMLGETKAPEERQALDQQGRELLRVVPEADSFELRINFAKATYLQAEEVVERDRLRLVSVADRSEAERVMRESGRVFEEIAEKAQRRVEQLERAERAGKEEELEAIREDLVDARRTRSLARYYAGWSGYYLGVLTGSPRNADRALQDFGVLLGAENNKAPALDRLPKSLLKYEHVARAAIGVAMCLSLRGNDRDAIRWIEEIEGAEEVSEPAKAQLFTRRLLILASADRWAEVEFAVKRHRVRETGKDASGADEKTDRTLTPPEARLLVVLALEATQRGKLPDAVKAMAERSAQQGFADLIARAEIGHVVDLVSRYGTTPIGESGFVVQYVRGLQRFEKTREAHRAFVPGKKDGKGVALSADEPTGEAPLVIGYREAAKLLESALASEDAERFKAEFGRAWMRRGLALYYADDLEEASKAFEAGFNAAGQADLREDALWYAIVSLDRGVESGKPSLASQRDRLAVLFLKNFPASENAVRLLLRQTQTELMGDEEAIKILLALPRESPVYEAARRQACRLMFRAYRKATGVDRSFAAIRFADLAEEVIRAQATRALSGSNPAADKGAADAAQSVVLHVRQIAEALLSLPTPDVARVKSALDALDGVAAAHRMDLSGLKGELEFRRLQIAVARNETREIEALLAKIRQGGGEFALAAERLLYHRALEAWRARSDDPALAEQVLRHGLIVLERASGNVDKAALLSVKVNLSEAAALVYRAKKDEAMRDRAVELCKQAVAAGARTAAVLKRLAPLAEERGELEVALDSWRDLLAGYPSGSPEWFEARYETLRLLWITDKPTATTVMAQHAVLYPDLGPSPWGDKLRGLKLEIEAAAARVAPPAQPAAPAKTGKAGGP